MRNRGQLIFGALLVLAGVIFLLGAIFHVDVGPICWSVLLIGVGIWLVLRPRWQAPGQATEVSLLGSIRRRGSWVVRSEEFWMGVGDLELDLMQATLPPGETVWRIYTFVSDVDIFVPQSLAVSVHANGFVVDAKLPDRNLNSFLSPVEYASPDFAMAENRLRIEMNAFVADMTLRRM